MDNLEKRIESLSPAKRALLELRLKQSSGRRQVVSNISSRKNPEQAPLSFAQERLWFLDQLEPNGALYNVPRAFRLKGELNLEALQVSLDKVAERHETFRTHFQLVDGDVRQVIQPSGEIPVTVTDLRDLPLDEREAAVTRLGHEEANRSFDLSHGPLMRARVLRLGEFEHVLLLTNHHIISDAWSGGILFKELSEIYNSVVTGGVVARPALPIQYADFAEWQRDWLQGEELQRQLGYWKEQLKDVSGILELPTDYVRSQSQPAEGDYKFLTLPKDLSRRLNELSHSEGATLFMTLLAAFQILLWRYTKQADIVVGSPIAGRTRSETENLIGFFINTLVLRSKLNDTSTFKEFLSQVKETALGAFAHQDLPFEKLVEELQPQRDLGRNPIFQVMFQFQNTSSPKLEMNGLEVSALEVSTGTSKFDLMLAAREEDDALLCVMEYNTGLFAGETIEHMLRQYTTLLAGIAVTPELAISNLSLMTAAEEQQLIKGWNDTAAEFPREKTIHQLFEEQVEHHPNATALIDEAVGLSFAELNTRANQLARYLRHRGVGPEVRVAICLERSIDMIVALLGVLKAGGAYVPLDPAYPAERLSFVIENSEAKLVLSQSNLDLPDLTVEVVRLDGIQSELSAEPSHNLVQSGGASNAAHVIYTSGSTGRPKGVISSHSASVNRFAWMWQHFPFAADEVCCQKTSLSFVDSIWEIFVPLLQSVPLVIIPDEVVKDSKRLVNLLHKHNVTRLVLVPSLLRAILEDEDDLGNQLGSLRICVCSGETLPASLGKKFHEQLPHTRLINLFGSSEVAADVTCFEVTTLEGEASVPIGRPIANTQVYILTDELRPAAIGVPGEIYVGGEGLARGYLNHPEMTAERFVPNPFVKGERLFRTGDAGRYQPDGNLEYRGRSDHQVKLRGFRIELGEIETTLKSHEHVEEAVVVLRSLADQKDGEPFLVAYLTATGSDPSTAELRSYLRAKLPAYMVPSLFVKLERMPLTASGKLNRLELPEPERADTAGEFVAPRTAVEAVLASIWAAELNLDRVSIEEDFFALGGHSLLLARIGARIREAFQLNLPLRKLFEASTIATLAKQIELAQRWDTDETELPLVAVSRDNGDNERVMSFAQERLWFFDQLEPGSAAYNISRAVKLQGPLNLDALRRSLTVLFARHEVLRSTFQNVDGRPVLKIVDEARPQITLSDLSLFSAAEREEATASFINEETAKAFDLSRGPLLQLALLKLNDEEQILVLTIHHIVSDGWSVGILLRELVAGYNANVNEQPLVLDTLPIQYSDYATWQRQYLSGSNLEKQMSFWRDELKDAPSQMNLPVDKARPAVRSSRGAREAVSLSLELSNSLKQLGRNEQATLFMTLLAAFQILLACVTGDDDIVVGSPTAGRSRPETEDLIGYFVNTIVLRTRVNDDLSFRQIVSQVRDHARGAFAHQDVPFEKLVDELGLPRTLEVNPLFQVWFVLQNALVERQEWQDLEVESINIESKVTRHDLQLSLWDAPGGLEGAFTYSTDLFEAKSIRRIAVQFRALLEAVSARPDIKLSEARAIVKDAGRVFEQQQAEQLEDASRERLRSVRRRAVGVSPVSEQPAENLETI